MRFVQQTPLVAENGKTHSLQHRHGQGERGVDVRRRDLYALPRNAESTMRIAVTQHDQSGNAEIGMVQVALVHRTVAHASARVLAMHDEIHQSLLVNAHVLYPSCCIVSRTQDHHGRQRPPRVAQIALLLRTSVQTAAIHLAVVQPRCYALETARSTTQLLRITAVHLVQDG